MGSSLKYFTLFQLGSKPIVFHFEFHEIDVRAKRSHTTCENLVPHFERYPGPYCTMLAWLAPVALSKYLGECLAYFLGQHMRAWNLCELYDQNRTRTVTHKAYGPCGARVK